jgi:hypothetical protein
VAVSKMELLELVRKAEAGDVDLLREVFGCWPRR